MGGLWGVIGTLRTINCWNYIENIVNQSHWFNRSHTPWGTRQADFYVHNGTLELITKYALNQTMPVLDWYWEQCNCWGVDKNARLVFGLCDNAVTEMKWRITNVPYVRWVWMKYTEWMTGKMRTVLFIFSQTCTISLREEHGNDITPMISVKTGAFQTLIRFDVSCPR